MKRHVGLVALFLAIAMFGSGCAIFYSEDTTHPDGSTEREVGLLGGCLPLWHYSHGNAVNSTNSPAR